MAFPLLEISLHLQTISFVSFNSDDGKMFLAHVLAFLSKKLCKREQFSIVLNENINGERSIIEWRIFYTFSKLVLFRLLVLVARQIQ